MLITGGWGVCMLFFSPPCSQSCWARASLKRICPPCVAVALRRQQERKCMRIKGRAAGKERKGLMAWMNNIHSLLLFIIITFILLNIPTLMCLYCGWLQVACYMSGILKRLSSSCGHDMHYSCDDGEIFKHLWGWNGWKRECSGIFYTDTETHAPPRRKIQSHL